MNYLTILLVVLLLLSLVEFSFARHKILCDQLFHIAFAFTVFWVGIKYYIGPDIFSYVPFYETIQPLKDIISGHYNGSFEIGFAIFCSSLKSIGFSFWGMTVAVTLIYFAAIYKLFKQLKSHRIFALFILMLLDANLVLYQFRECLAVSFYLLMVLFLFKKKYIASFLMIILATAVHKSGLFMCIGTFLVYELRFIKINKQAYILLFMLLILFLIIPLKEFILPIIDQLPLQESVVDSIKHHLLLEKNFQTIFIVYAVTLFCTAYYSRFSKEDAKWHWIIFACLLIIVILFQYYFILNRLRSYFLPLALVYIINAIVTSEHKSVLPKQILVLSILLFAANFYRRYNVELENSISKINIGYTVFDLKHKSEEQIKKEQMEKAAKFWEYEYLNQTQN